MHHFGSWKVTLLLVILTLFVIWTSSPDKRKTNDLETKNINRPTGSFQQQLYQYMELQNTDVYYQIPQQRQPQGILIFFHGCNHDGGDLFLLPEDRLVAKAALDRNLALLSITSIDRESGCWTNLDVTNVPIIVQEWLSTTGLSNRSLPRIGMGASSGGSFLFHIYKQLQLKSMASYISPTMFDNPSQGIPTIFVHMPRDVFSGAAIQRNHATLVAQGIASQIIPIDPHPLTPELLCTERIPELDRSTCQKILEKAISLHLLDTNYTVWRTDAQLWSALVSKYDKRNRDWKKSEKKKNNDRGKVSWLVRVIHEEVAAAYAYHEMTAEKIEQVLDFLIAHAGIQKGNRETDKRKNSSSLTVMIYA
jgi:hypothetical protein